MDRNEVEMLGAGSLNLDSAKRILGNKQYELSNHLGNVLTTVSDKKVPIDENSDNALDYYIPELLTATDYYAFGQPMPGRNFTNNSNYRDGFNGQEKDDEVYGNGDIYTYEYRIADTRLGRFWSVDPLAYRFAWNSTYSFCENRVISAIELEGLEAWDLNGSQNVNHAEGEQGPNLPENQVNGPYKDQSAANHAAINGAEINAPETVASDSPLSAIANRSANPSLIDQGNTSLCGPTTIAQALATHNKVGYQNAVKAFYQLNLPGNDAINHMGMTSMSDWYLLTGLKKLVSPIPYGDQTSGGLEGFQGMTPPYQMQAMADIVGLKTFENTLGILPGVGNMTVDDFFSNLDKYAQQGQTVILLINSEVLNRTSESNYPDHYVIYEAGSYKTYEDGCMEFTAQTWGKTGVKFGPVSKAMADLKGLHGALILGK